MSAFVKPLTLILGIVLLLIGVLGYIMESPLLGLFAVNSAHNLVHIASGIVALLAASKYTYSRLYLIIFGLVYGVVTILGFLSVGDGSVVSLLGLLDVNSADNYLHLLVSAACLIVGFGSKGKAAM